jgi:coenzyme PQQ precursor peptide PqqA
LARIQAGESDMRWELPQAIDFRFGMEITMYIARR